MSEFYCGDCVKYCTDACKFGGSTKDYSAYCDDMLVDNDKAYNMALDDLTEKVCLNFNDWALSVAPMFDDDKDYELRKAVYETITQAIEGIEENAKKLKRGGVKE